MKSQTTHEIRVLVAFARKSVFLAREGMDATPTLEEAMRLGVSADIVEAFLDDDDLSTTEEEDIEYYQD